MPPPPRTPRTSLGSLLLCFPQTEQVMTNRLLPSLEEQLHFLCCFCARVGPVMLRGYLCDDQVQGYREENLRVDWETWILPSISLGFQDILLPRKQRDSTCARKRSLGTESPPQSHQVRSGAVTWHHEALQLLEELPHPQGTWEAAQHRPHVSQGDLPQLTLG